MRPFIQKAALSLVLILLNFVLVSAQSEMGEWRLYFAYQNIQWIEEADNKLFVLADQSLFSYDHVNDGEIQTYTKQSGLSDTEISLIRYNPEKKMLVVVYANSNIDLMTEKGIYNLPDVYLKTVMGSKQINDIFFRDDLLYLSAECGLIVVNTLKHEVTDTYMSGSSVKSCCLLSDDVYAFTPTGIMKGNKKQNLLDKNNWHKQSDLIASRASLFNNTAVAWKEVDGVYSLNISQDKWVKENGHGGTIAQSSYGNRFIEYSAGQLFIYTSFAQPSVMVSLKEMSAVSYRNNNNTIWAGIKGKGLCAYKISPEGIITETITEQIRPEGPASNQIYNGQYNNGKLHFITSGPMYISSQFTPAQIMQRTDDHKWINVDRDQVSTFTGISFDDALSMAIDPTDPNHFFVSTWWLGLYEFRDNQCIKRHCETNSAIEPIYGGDRYLWVNGLQYDKHNNLWMLNNLVRDIVKVLKPDGTWSSIYLPSISNTESIDRLTILRKTPGEHKWILARRTNIGLLVFDDNGTIDDISDDKQRFFSTFQDQDGKTISSTGYSCMVEDRSGYLWVGTNKGPIVFTQPGKAFDGSFRCTRIKIPRNDGTQLADFLLETENVTSIAVDGGDRKWIGTSSNGVYLISPDGQEIVHHFTTINSVLPSNNVLSVTIHPHTGEVYFGTMQGLASYRAEATEPTEEFTDVHSYPNPVRPEYIGPVTITGLMEDTQVKVVNSAGQLMWQGVSIGGQATWNAIDGTGNRVKTGVYLVFCSTPDGKTRVATKILVVN